MTENTNLEILTHSLACLDSFIGAFVLVIRRKDAFLAFRAFAVFAALVDGLLGLALDDVASAVVLRRRLLFAGTAFLLAADGGFGTRFRHTELLHEPSFLLAGSAFPWPSQTSL